MNISADQAIHIIGLQCQVQLLSYIITEEDLSVFKIHFQRNRPHNSFTLASQRCEVVSLIISVRGLDFFHPVHTALSVDLNIPAKYNNPEANLPGDIV